jgi:hypothetical protein
VDKTTKSELEKLLESTYRSASYQTSLLKPKTSDIPRTEIIEKKFITKETRPPQVDEYAWR